MKITCTSMMSGKTTTRDIPVTQEQLRDWVQGRYIQDAMPNISPDDREFIMTGITPEEWEEAFGSQTKDIHDLDKPIYDDDIPF